MHSLGPAFGVVTGDVSIAVSPAAVVGTQSPVAVVTRIADVDTGQADVFVGG